MMQTSLPARAGVAAKSMFALNAIHTELDEQFLRHQEHLLCGRIDEARTTLDIFVQGFALHVKQEEEFLLPIYAARGRPQPPVQRLQLTVFRHEHQKLLRMLDRITGQLACMHKPAARQLIGLLEREAVFKHVLEHHGKRENQVLFPELNRVTTEAERAAIMQQLLYGWMSAMRPEHWINCVAACSRGDAPVQAAIGRTVA